MKKILVIQTAFIGDVVLATALIENLHQQWPEVKMDILVRKGNESLFESHPFLNQVLVWDKKNNKYHHWVGLLFKIRSNHYDVVINAQRFAATGAWTALSGAKIKIGFDKNPFSFLFTNSVVHQFSEKGQHEIDRNHQLLSCLFEAKVAMPKLYPTTSDELAVINYQQAPYLCIAPASVWFTKQAPPAIWQYAIEKFDEEGVQFYLLGGPDDHELCESIKLISQRNNVHNLAGKLSLMQSAALMKDAKRNFVNDSGPLHIASAGNAPVSAFFCSTTPEFGFGPLSDDSSVIEVKNLACRPCGLHGHKACPKGHFQCGNGLIEAMNR